MRLSAFDAEAITRILAELKEEATRFVRSCDGEAEILCDYKVFMRYTGRGGRSP